MGRRGYEKAVGEICKRGRIFRKIEGWDNSSNREEEESEEGGGTQKGDADTVDV